MDNLFTLFSLLRQIGLIPATVPSLVFVLTILLVFNPGFDLSSVVQQQSLLDSSVYVLLPITILVFIFSYILTSLNNFILKIFEGYIIPFPIRFLYNKSRRIHLQKAYNLRRHRDLLETKVRELKKLAQNDPAWETELGKWEERHYKAAAEYGLTYPEDLNDVMPTRFGNILKAAENYPGERYGFDGVLFWPRLVQVIPAEYKENLDSTRNELSFLVYMSIVSVVFSVLCIIAIFLSFWDISRSALTTVEFLDVLLKGLQYLPLAILGFFSSYFFYNASVFSVHSFGLIIRSTCDLFRLDLLKKLDMERPKDSIEEFDTWNNLNELIVLGNHSTTFQKLNYREKE